jgi:hypothetical protein
MGLERFDGLTNFSKRTFLSAIITVGCVCVIVSTVIVWTFGVAGLSVVTVVDEASRAVKRHE